MNLPDSMRCVEALAGRPLSLGSRPLPDLKPGEVLVAVEAAGVNRPDLIQREGHYPPPPGASDIMGLEISGRVVARAPDVQSPEIGAAVCALVTGGGYAEYCAAAAALCLPIPGGFTWIEAAALPETLYTVWHNVFERGRLQPGETLLVHGGGSGIGTTAIQLAKAMGARVFTTAGGLSKCAACRALGADLAIDYQSQDFVAEVTAATEKRGVDVILDMVGGETLTQNIKILAMDGRMVSIAFLQGSTALVNFMPVMLKRLTLTGSTLRPQSVAAKALIASALRQNVWPLLESGQIKPQIFRSFPLADAEQAQALMQSRSHFGKIVLTLS